MKKIITTGVFLGAAWVAPNFALADGAETYANVCSACHGENGKGAEGMDGMPDLAMSLAKDDGDLFNSVINGIEKPDADLTMPARGGDDSLSDDDIKAVIAYIRQTFGS